MNNEATLCAEIERLEQEGEEMRQVRLKLYEERDHLRGLLREARPFVNFQINENLRGRIDAVLGTAVQPDAGDIEQEARQWGEDVGSRT